MLSKVCTLNHGGDPYRIEGVLLSQAKMGSLSSFVEGCPGPVPGLPATAEDAPQHLVAVETVFKMAVVIRVPTQGAQYGS